MTSLSPVRAFERDRAARALWWLPLAVVLISRSASAEPGVADSAPGEASADEAEPPGFYRVALGGGASAGDPGWGTELGRILEIDGRYQPLPWLGVGATFFDLVAPNNENYPTFHAEALELNVAWHPLGYLWFDPFVRAGAVGFVALEGESSEDAGRFGFDGMLGVNAAFSHVAVGLHIRHGFTSASWTMLGLHLEGRI